ncbi:MAG: c-type cytochrome [Candidatus Anammoxibacter sp.]
MRNQNIIFFAVSGFLVFLTIAVIWKDYNREWKQYQRTFYKMQVDLAKTEEEKKEILNQKMGIKQIILKQNNADRCITCHLGLEDTRFKNAPQPFSAHPGKNHHSFEKFGCTVCHHGQGLATTVESAHGYVSFWEEPLLPREEIQSTCSQCHDQIYLEDGPVISRGKELFISLGCHGCHKTKGYENLYKVGPSLKRIGSKVDHPWLVRWIKEPSKYQPDTKMPYFRFSEEEAISIAAYLISQSDPDYHELIQYDTGDVSKGRNLFKTIGCLGCHRMGKEGNPFAPDLSHVGDKVKPDWLVNWFLHPRGYNPNTIMPKFRLSIKEAKDLSAFILTVGSKQKVPKFEEEILSPERIKQGKELIRKRGCTACHDINGIEHARIGPELSKFGAKLPTQLDFGNTNVTVEALAGFLKGLEGREISSNFLKQLSVKEKDIGSTWLTWVQTKLKDPTAYDTELHKSNMPTFNITEKDIKALAVFLKGMEGREISSNFLRQLSVREFEIDQGRKSIAKYNCRGCHEIAGKGGDILKFYKGKYYAPPTLERGGLHVGERLKDSWMYSFLREPTPSVRRWLKVKMPTFLLSQDEIYYIIRYFVNLAEEKISYEPEIRDIPPESRRIEGSKEQEHVVNGRGLFLHYCASCHGNAGKGDGFNSVNLDPVPRDLSDQQYMAKQKNQDLFKVISSGGKAIEKSARMPPYGNTLSEIEIWKIIAFIRTLHSYKDETISFEGLNAERPKTVVNKISSDKFQIVKKKDIMRGKSLYKKLGCSACHNIGGQGGNVGPELTHAGKRLNETWIHRFLKSPQNMLKDVTMPNYGLSDKTALTLTYYLVSLK